MSAQLWVSPLDGMTLTVEAAFGADLTDTDGSGWSWTDITTDVRQNPGITTSLGRDDESGRSNPAELSMTLDNTDGRYSVAGTGAHWPNVRQGTPVRVRIDPDDGAGVRTVFFGFATSWTPGWAAAGRVPTVALGASGTIRRLQQGAAPIPSAFRRGMTALSTVVAYWPFEEGASATYAAPVRGGSNMIYSGAPEFDQPSPFAASGPMVKAGTGAFVGQVTPYTDTGANQARFLLSVPDDGVPDGTVLMHVYTTGTLGRFDLTYENPGSGGNMGLFIYNADGSLNTSQIVTFTLNGQNNRVSVEFTQVGSDVSWSFSQATDNPAAGTLGFGATITGKTCGIIHQIELMPHGDGGDLVFGHLTVENTVTTQSTDKTQLLAYYGEYPATGTPVGRITRLCTENGLDLTRYTEAVAVANVPTREQMGAQPIATLLDALYEVEDADRGQLWDGRGPGLAYTTRRYREDAAVALTLDARAGQLGQPFQPVADDQRLRNRAEVSRSGGVTAVYEDDDGPLGTDMVGVYDTAQTVSTVADSMALQHAGWIVALGTVEGYRYPTVTVDLRVNPDLAGDVLDLKPGDQVLISNPDDVLDGFPAGDIRLIVEGIAHDVGAAGWQAELRCSPGEPWAIGRVASPSGDASEFVGRLEGDGSTLGASAPRNSTSISVVTASGPLWTTAADDFPLYLDVGGVPVRATACAGSTSPQTFTVDPMEFDRTSGVAVTLYHQHLIGL